MLLLPGSLEPDGRLRWPRNDNGPRLRVSGDMGGVGLGDGGGPLSPSPTILGTDILGRSKGVCCQHLLLRCLC